MTVIVAAVRVTVRTAVLKHEHAHQVDDEAHHGDEEQPIVLHFRRFKHTLQQKRFQ